jgi:hypothetical protein
VLTIGLLVGTLVGPRTVTHTSTVFATTITGVPAGCRQAISLTRRLERAGSREAIARLRAQFEVAAAGCEIPEGCRKALTYFPKIEAEPSRAKLIALARDFEAAAAECG